MIEEHFGLRETPFTREIAIDKKMTLPFLDEQAQTMEDIVKRRMSALIMAPAHIEKSIGNSGACGAFEQRW